MSFKSKLFSLSRLSPTQRKLSVLGCLLFSGYAGLAYELLWVRLLSFAFGSTTQSFATVLAVFFGGLALGSWIAARFLHKVNRPIRFYGVIEGVTGLVGLALYPLLKNLSWFYATIDQGPDVAGTAVRFVVACALLLPPTLLMGMTLPVICKGLIQRDSDVGEGAGFVYGFNTLGAFLGTYLITYHLLPELGIFRATLTTVAVNFLVAAVAWCLDPGKGPILSHSPPTLSPATGPKAPLLRVALLATFLSGFSFICMEIVWSRIFSIVLSGTIYGVGSVLIAILFGIGMGSLLVTRAFRSKFDLVVLFVMCQLGSVAGVYLLIHNLPAVAYALVSIQEVKTAIDPIHWQLAFVFMFLAIPALCSGCSFPLLLRIVEDQAQRTGQSLGRIYAVNTLGSILGSVLTGFVLLPQFGTNATLFISLLVIVVMSVIVSALLTSTATTRRVALALNICVAALALTFDGYDPQTLVARNSSRGLSIGSWEKQMDDIAKSTIFFAEGKTASVRVSGRGGQTGLSLNGLGQGGRQFLPPHEIFESLLVGLVPLIHHPQPDNALVVGLGAGTTVDVLHQAGLRTKVIELEAQVVEAQQTIFMEDDSPVGKEGVDIEVNDARHFLLTNARNGDERFDIITSMPAHPWVAANIFTQEFFELAKRNLTSHGVFTTWFGVSSMSETAVKSLIAAFVKTFPSYIVYHIPETGALYVVGGADFKMSLPRLKSLMTQAPFHGWQDKIDPLFFAARLIGSGTGVTPRLDFAPVNTDDSAYVEISAPRRADRIANFDLKDVLPQRVMDPALVDLGDREGWEFDLETFETQVGTPGGQLPIRPRPTLIPQAKLSLAFLPERLSPAFADYAEMRIECAENLYVKRVRDLSGLDMRLRARARKFYTLCTLGHDAFASRLAAHSAAIDFDLIARLATYDLEKARAMVPSTLTTPPRSPALDSEDLEPSRSGLAGIERDKVALLTHFRDRAPWEATQPFAKFLKTHRWGVAQLLADVVPRGNKKRLAEGRAAKLQTQRFHEISQKGQKHFLNRAYTQAWPYYRAAFPISPANVNFLKQYYQVAKALGLADEQTRTEEQLALLGKDRAWITSLDQLVAKSIKEGKLATKIERRETSEVEPLEPTAAGREDVQD